jgi:hypothetical protein
MTSPREPSYSAHATLLPLTDSAGRPVIVRMWDVTNVRQQGRKARISMRNGDTVLVKETVEQILGMVTKRW